MKDHKLSNQAVGAIMMALQKSLMEQTDIVPVLPRVSNSSGRFRRVGCNESTNG